MAGDIVPRFRIELFGGPRVRTGSGETITFQAKPGAILTLLALAPGHRMSREELAEALWPDEPHEVTRDRLKVALSALRNAVPDGSDLLPPGTQTVCLNRGAGVTIDTEEFDRLRDEALNVLDTDTQSKCLSRLDDLYAGSLAPGIFVDEVVRARDLYEQKIVEIRRSLKVLTEVRDASRHIKIVAATERAGAAPDVPSITSAGRPIANSHRPRLFSQTALALSVFTAGIIALLGGWILLRPRSAVPCLTPEQRIRMLVALRNHGSQAEMPHELEARMRQQADQCLALAEEAWRSWYGPDEQAWIARLQPIDGDIQNSIQWLLDHDPNDAVQLVGALSRYWWIPNRREQPRRWLDIALTKTPTVDSPARARALAFHAMCTLQSVNVDLPPVRKINLQALAEIGAAHAMYDRLNDAWGQAQTHRCMAHIIHALRRDGEAERTFEQAMRGFLEVGDTSGEAYTCWGMSLLRLPGETPHTCQLRQVRLLLRSLQLYGRQGNHAGIANSFADLTGHVKGWMLLPSRSSRSEVAVLLKGYEDECQARLQRPEVLDNPAETLELHRLLARVAIALVDRSTAVEQLGYLISQQGDVRLRASPAFPDLADTYLRYIRETPNPPISPFEAEQIIARGCNAHARPKHLKLEEAIQIAAR